MQGAQEYFSHVIHTNMKLIKESQKGRVYQTEKCKVLYRKKGTITGDNRTNSYERIYLIVGEALVTLLEEQWQVTAPAEFEFPERMYHKIEALTDISLIVFDE